MGNRIAGKLFITVGSRRIWVAGQWTCNPGFDKREGRAGPNEVLGFSETAQIPFIEGEGAFRPDVDATELLDAKDVPITAELANGQVFVMSDAWQAGDGTINLSDGTIALRYEGMKGEFVKA